MKSDIPLPRPGKLSAILGAGVFALAILGGASVWLHFGRGRTGDMGLGSFFYLEYEANLPSWYSAMLLLASGLLLLAIARVKWVAGDRFRRHWFGLGVLFVVFSADDISRAHEFTIAPIRSVLPVDGVFHYAWVIPALPFVFVVGILYIPFLFRLPPRTKALFIVAGGLYVGAALGFELLTGAYAAQHGESNLGYATLVSIEEALEMVALVILIHACLDYLQKQLGIVGIRWLKASSVKEAGGRAEQAGTEGGT